MKAAGQVEGFGPMQTQQTEIVIGDWFSIFTDSEAAVIVAILIIAIAAVLIVGFRNNFGGIFARTVKRFKSGNQGGKGKP